MTGHAIVIGAGIGGLAAAKALQHNGWEVEIFDKAADFDPLGSGLSIAPNGLAALRHLGLGEAFSPRAKRVDALEGRVRSGRTVMRIDSTTLTTKYGGALYAMHRADLHALLRESLATVPRTDHLAIGLSPDKGTVTFEGPEGLSARAADLIVAADGVNSRMRTALFPDYPGPRHAGYGVWRGIVPASSAPPIESLTTETWGNGVRIGVMPLQDGRIYWYCFDSTTDAADIHALARESGPWPDPIPAMLAATPDDAVMHHEVNYLAAPLPAFVRGSVALLGDAAHAVTPDLGQGACLAIEDAVALANDVTVHGVTAGLRVYDTNRRPRTQSIVRASARMGAAVHGANRPAAVLRDALIRLLPISANSRFSASLYGWKPPQAPKVVAT